MHCLQCTHGRGSLARHPRSLVSHDFHDQPCSTRTRLCLSLFSTLYISPIHLIFNHAHTIDSLGWFNSAAGLVHAGTYYTALAESTAASSVYAIDISSGHIKARLRGAPPFSTLHAADELLLGVAACTDGAPGDCLYRMPLALTPAKAELVAHFPSGWAAVDTHGTAIIMPAASTTKQLTITTADVTTDNYILYSLAVDVANLTINHDSLFGFQIAPRAVNATVVSQPGRPYGGPVISTSEI